MLLVKRMLRGARRCALAPRPPEDARAGDVDSPHLKKTYRKGPDTGQTHSKTHYYTITRGEVHALGHSFDNSLTTPLQFYALIYLFTQPTASSIYTSTKLSTSRTTTSARSRSAGIVSGMISLDQLPADVLELIAGYYLASRRADDEHHASAVLQARLRRHLTQRCEDPAHAGYTNSSSRRVPCYAATHAHPRRVVCGASRKVYFVRICESFAESRGAVE